jgi:hypothetical protein
VYSHDERPYHAFLAILIRFRNTEFTTEQARLFPPRKKNLRLARGSAIDRARARGEGRAPRRARARGIASVPSFPERTRKR